jgi:hypothetical protein
LRLHPVRLSTPYPAKASIPVKGVRVCQNSVD